ncbi:hypothetical protein OC844_007557 [Tilletia horrida]|nr:hypothetical protein OC844_007557 [Tilletia horrida]
MSIQYGEASAVAVGSPVTPERMAMAALTKAVSTKIKRRRGLHNDTLKDKNEIHKQLNDANTELNKANLKLQGVRKAMA